jgi:hypothetical protein
MKDFRPEYLDQAFSQFDPQRSHSENVSRIMDSVSQFTGPLSGADRARLEFEIDDEMARRRGSSFFPFDL